MTPKHATKVKQHAAKIAKKVKAKKPKK